MTFAKDHSPLVNNLLKDRSVPGRYSSSLMRLADYLREREVIEGLLQQQTDALGRHENDD